MTTTDKRELILARICLALLELKDYNVYRNKDEVADAAKPAIVVLDGNEQVVDDDAERLRRPSNAPVLVAMMPEIVVLLDAASQDVVGTKMSEARAAVVKTLALDEALNAIVGTNGKIRYEGCETQIATGRRIEGQVLVKVTFVYPLEYAKL